MNGSTVPRLSVIVPAAEKDDAMERALTAILATDLPRSEWELIVVDDGGGEEVALLAARFADIVVRLPGPSRGPAYARNRGREVARGALLVFVDPDVAVAPDCLRRLTESLDANPSVGAVVAVPRVGRAEGGIATQFRELRHLYEERRGSADSLSFWTDCGAIRASVFDDAGMCDELCLDQPRLEAAELGRRIRMVGRIIQRCGAATMTPLRRWRVTSLLARELRDHGVPWEDAADASTAPRDEGARSLRRRTRLVLALPLVAMTAALIAVAYGAPRLLYAAAALAALGILLSAPLYWFFLRQRGPFFFIAALPLHWLTWIAGGLARAQRRVLQHTLGEQHPDPTVQAFTEVGLTVWPPLPVKRRATERGASSRA